MQLSSLQDILVDIWNFKYLLDNWTSDLVVSIDPGAYINAYIDFIPNMFAYVYFTCSMPTRHTLEQLALMHAQSAIQHKYSSISLFFLYHKKPHACFHTQRYQPLPVGNWKGEPVESSTLIHCEISGLLLILCELNAKYCCWWDRIFCIDSAPLCVCVWVCESLSEAFVWCSNCIDVATWLVRSSVCVVLPWRWCFP